MREHEAKDVIATADFVDWVPTTSSSSPPPPDTLQWLEEQLGDRVIGFDEARILAMLGEIDLDVGTPVLVAADPDGVHCDVPAIVMTEVPGAPEIEPPIAADLAHCRWNLAVLGDPLLADHFTAHYRTLTGYSEDIQLFDLSTVLSGPVGPFPTHAWNALGRVDLTSATVAPMIDTWLRWVLDE